MARQFHSGCTRVLGEVDLEETVSGAPEPNQVNVDKVDLKGFYSLSIRKSFVYCRQDRALPAGYFYPRMSSRLGECKFLEMDGSHEVMFTRPQELAARLIEAGTD